MKKVLCALLVAVLPIGLLAGCGESNILNKIATNKNAPDFLYSIMGTLENFQANIKNQSLNVDGYLEDLSADETASTIYSQTIWPMLEKANDENLFAFLAYNMARQNYKNGFYDLSFLSNTQSPYLDSFFLEKLKSENGKVVYVGKLAGVESEALNLPLPTTNITTFIDNADTVIKKLGNHLSVTVEYNALSTKVKVGSMFLMPTEDELITAIGTKDMDYVYDQINNTILLKYSESGVTYTKEVKFEVDVSGSTIKTVTRYAGDKIAQPNLSDGKAYTYSLKTSNSSNRDLVWEYELTFSENDSGIYAQQKQGNHFVVSEYYLTHSGEIVARISESTSAKRVTIDLLIESNLSEGQIKYNQQSSSIKDKIIPKLLSRENALLSTFCDITEKENKLALNNNSNNVKILKYDINAEKIAIEYAGEKVKNDK